MTNDMKKEKEKRAVLENPKWDGTTLEFGISGKTYEVDAASYAKAAAKTPRRTTFEERTEIEKRIFEKTSRKKAEDMKNRKFKLPVPEITLEKDPVFDEKTAAEAEARLSSECWNSFFGAWDDVLRSVDEAPDGTVEAFSEDAMKSGFDFGFRPLCGKTENEDFVVLEDVPAIFCTDHEIAGRREIWRRAFPPPAWCGKEKKTK